MLQPSPELTDVIDHASFGCGDEDEDAVAAADEDEADEDEEEEDDADEEEDDADEDEDEDEDGTAADEDDTDTVPRKESHILDCRNGRLLLNRKRRDDSPYAEFGLFRPLDEQLRVALLLPLPDPRSFVNDLVLRFLPDAGGKCVVISLSFDSARFCVLRQDDIWSITVCTGTGPFPQITYCEDNVLVRNNLYVLAADGYIVRFEFSPEAEAVSSSVIQLPVGVKVATEVMPDDKPVALSRGYDSGVYFIHIKDSHLCAWLYSINADAWLMDAYISLPEAFTPFEDQIVGPEDFFDDLRIFGAGDHADFVFLAAGEDSHIYYLNLRTKTLEAVYELRQKDGAVLDIRPFMMV